MAQTKKILLVDNYDSFVYNLYQYIGEQGYDLLVKRNDAFDVADVANWNLGAIVISPGPKTPKDAGVIVPLIQHYSGTIPILGVCLGHQAIGQAFGVPVVNATKVCHGKISQIEHNEKNLFAGVESPTPMGRYHSLVLDEKRWVESLQITARARDDNEIMAIQHIKHPTFGVQFHLESILSPNGKQILQNFLALSFH